MKKFLLKALFCALIFPLSSTFNLNAQQLGYTNAYPSLTFDTPLEIVPSNDGSNRLFIIEKTGYIYQIKESTGAKSLVANLSSIVSSGRDGTEIGLLGMALHPNFSSNKRFYIYYITGSPPYKVNLAQLTLNEGNPAATANSRKVVFTATKPTSHHTHNGGHIEFGPDGYLYMGIGDGGDSAGNGNERAQDLSHIFGSILRIGINTNGTFFIPSSNPYASSGDVDTRKIWIFGLRNPWKFSFHGNKLWIGDVGASQQDEINRVSLSHGGSNYGWGRWEGTYQNQSAYLNGGALRAPYFTKSATSLTGGYVYEGSLTNPEIQGKYVFADYISGDVWAINADSGPDSTNPSLATNRESLVQAKLFTTSPDDAAIVSFGRNESGTELYFLRFGQNYDSNPNSSNAYNYSNNSGAIFKITGQQSNENVAVNGIGNFDQCAINLNGRVNALETVNNSVWIGGNFTNAQGASVSKLVAYDKNTGFSASYYITGEVEDIHAAANGDVWIGGNFSKINGINAKNLAQLSNGLIINHNSSGVVYEIDSAPNGAVYFIGASTSVSGVSISKFARYNGSSWSNMNTYPNNEIRALEVASNGDIIIGGNFTAVGNVAANRIARYAGGKWNSYPGANSLFVKEIEEYRGYIYVGGQNYMGRYSVSNRAHQVLSRGIAGGEVRAITSDGNNIYIGGTFSTVSNDNTTNLIMKGLAQWSPNTNKFSALGSGTNVGSDYIISDLAYANGNLAIGGEFTDIGNYFALWSTGAINCPSSSQPSCNADIVNSNTAMPLTNRLKVGNVAVRGIQNNALCEMELSSSSGKPWARYVIPINLAAEGISAGDQITISLEGKSGSGAARIEVSRNNLPNTYVASRNFGSAWTTFNSTFTVPSNTNSLDVWLFSNFNNLSGSGNARYKNLRISTTGGNNTNCNKDIANLNTAMPLNNRVNVGNLTATGISNGAACEMKISSPSGQPWARYVIPINLAAQGIAPGDRLSINVDGRTGSGSAQLQVVRNNTPNTSLLTRNFGGSWSNNGGEIIVPSGVASLDVWLFSNFKISSRAGDSYFRNLNITVTKSNLPCTKDIANQNTAMPLNNRTSAGNLSVKANTVGASCEMELSSPSGQPWTRYVIPINLAAEGLKGGDRLNITIDGRSGSGKARIEVNRNNVPNDNLLYKTFGSSWSTHNRTITVPYGVSSLDIWLFSNYNRSSGAGNAYFKNLRVSKVTGASLKASFEPIAVSEENLPEAVKVFPNPSTSKLTVNLPNELDYRSYALFSVNGALVKNGTIDKNQKTISLSIDDLESGLYLLTLSDDNGNTFTKKIIKK